ncbi:MAG: RHS repeat domain-containing protein, partial [Roseiflexaceae bacterium]
TLGDVRRVSRVYDIPLGDPTGLTLHTQDSTSTYDSYGNRLTTTSYAGAGTWLYNGSVTSWSAPGSGSAARTSTTSYDDPSTTLNESFSGLPTQLTNPLSQSERAAYDYRMGALLRVTGPNTTGTPTNCAAASYTLPATEASSCAQYDVFGRMVKLVRPGDSTSYPTLLAAYADSEQPFRYRLDRRETAGSANVRIEQQFYDGLGRQIQTKQEGPQTYQNIIVDSRYDALNRATAQSQPRYVAETATTFVQYTAPPATLFNQTTRTYDELDRPVRTTTPDTHWTEHTYGLVGSLAYHDVVDASRHRTQTRSDAQGRRVNVYEISGDCGTSSYSWASCVAPTTTTWATYATTTYAYDALDQLTTVTDTAGNVTSMTYDSLGRKRTMDDPDLGVWSYSYDANSNLLTQTDAKGQTLWFGYDTLNRLTAKRQTSASGTLLASYTYDQTSASNKGIGQRTAMGVPSGASTSWEYDARGRSTKTTYTVPGLTGTRVFTTSYDSADRLVTRAYPAFPNGIVQRITYGYDAAWRPSSLFTSNWNVNLINGATYTALSQPDRWTFYNGVIQNWSYSSPLQRLSQLQAGSSASPSSVFDRGYTYDNIGNVTTIVDNTTTPIPNQSYSYDHRDRLMTWTLGSTTQTYTYNVLGNITSKPGNGVYTYPASGPSSTRPHTPSAVNGAAYTYDANGNLTSGGGRTYTWNIDNLPASISQTSGSESYTYDADGERIKKVAGSVTTVYLEGLWEEVVGGTPKAYYRFNGQTAVMYTYSPSAFLFLTNDHLGSVSVATDGAQTKTQQEYDPWGKVRSGGIGQTSINYTGQRLDGTGLLYYHARMYDPVLGRFVSADSIIPGQSDQAGTSNPHCQAIPVACLSIAYRAAISTAPPALDTGQSYP